MIRMWAEYSSEELKGVKTAILPIGATEQHGPHLPVGTDSYLIEGLVKKLLGRETSEDIMILPLIPYGKSTEHMAFPGTITLSARTLISLLEDVARSLAKQGVQRFIVLSGHGGNNGIVDGLLYDLHEELGIGCYAMHFGQMYMNLGTADCGFPKSFHAGHAETSIMKYIRPEFEHLYQKAEGQVDSKGFDFVRDASLVSWGWHSEDISAHGYIGDPSGSNVEDGKYTLDRIADFVITRLELIFKKGE